MKNFKKRLLTLSMVLFLLIGLSACKDNNASKATEPVEKEGEPVASSEQTNEEDQGEDKLADFSEEDGKLVYLDLEDSPFEEGGLKIEVDKEDESVNFLITDDSGNTTLEYYNFDFKDNQMVKYKYVSMMGRGFYYIYDLEGDELVRMEDDDHNDTTASAKENGRFDGPAAESKEDVQKLEDYFTEKFGMTIKEAIN